ncbi:MAG: IPT/TIG domain-containing protein [Cyclobacteriaceae bacterium]
MKRDKIPTQCVLVLFVLTSSFGLRHACAQSPQWQSEGYGTYAGAINSVVVTPTGRLIAGTIWDGFFISDDEGVSWTASNVGFVGFDNRLPTLKVIGTKIFAGTQTGLFISNDNGDTWSSSGVSGTFVRNLVEVGSNIVITTANNMLYSNDGGGSWLPVTGIGNYYMTAFTQLGTSLFGVSDNKVFVSNNNGESWSETTSISSSFLASYDIIAVGGTLICSTNIGMFQSTDVGATWVLVDNTKQYGKMSIINGDLYLGTDYGIFKSSDAGATWSLINSNLNNTPVMQFAEHNGNIFVATAKPGILFSNDNGLTWTNRDNGLVNPYINSLAARGETFIAATNHGLFVSLGSPKAWSPVPTAPLLRYTSIITVDDKFIAGTDSNGIYISEDDGLTWVNSNDNLSELSVRTLNFIGNRIWCGTQNGLFYSTDLGTTWNATSVSGMIYAVAGRDAFVYAMVPQQGMKVSTDWGSTWSNANTGLPPSFSQPVLRHMAQLGDKIYFGDPVSKKIYHTDLGSSVWTIYKNTDGIGLTTDGINLYYGPTIDEVITDSGLSTISLGFPNHLLFDRAMFMLAHNSRLYICFNSNLYTGPSSGVIYSTSISETSGISYLNPIMGKVGSTLTIVGYNLNDFPKRVFFNNMEGTVLSSSPTTWTVAIPPASGEAAIKVIVGNFELALTQKFKIIPELKSITPSEALVGSRITIEGSGLDPNVFYNIKYGLYSAGFIKPNSTGRLIATVPDIAYKGPISLITNEVSISSEEQLLILPSITDFSPKQAQAGELITITGSGFSNTPGDNTVKFNGIQAAILSNHKNTLTVMLPTGATSGLISATTHDRSVYSEQPFVALPLPTDCSWGPVQPTISQIGFYDSTFPILQSSSEGGNSWYLNGELVENDFGNYLLAINSGIYTVQINTDGCLSPLSEGFEASVLVTGIDNEKSENTIGIYPNPVGDELILDLKSIQNSELVDITIFNQLGIPVYLNKESGGKVEYIDLSHLSTGIYFIKVESPSYYSNSKLIKK